MMFLFNRIFLLFFLFFSDYKRLLELGSNSSDIHYNWGKLHDRIYSSQTSFLFHIMMIHIIEIH